MNDWQVVKDQQLEATNWIQEQLEGVDTLPCSWQHREYLRGVFQGMLKRSLEWQNELEASRK